MRLAEPRAEWNSLVSFVVWLQPAVARIFHGPFADDHNHWWQNADQHPDCCSSRGMEDGVGQAGISHQLQWQHVGVYGADEDCNVGQRDASVVLGLVLEGVGSRRSKCIRLAPSVGYSNWENMMRVEQDKMLRLVILIICSGVIL